MNSKTRPRASENGAENEEDELQREIPYSMFSTTRDVKHTELYLSAPVAEAEHCEALCNFFRASAIDDTVNLYLNSDGGDIASGIALITAMRESKATITTILNPQAFSMGALLYLCGDKKVVPQHSLLMFHNYSSSLYGKGNEQMAEVQAMADWYAQVLRDVCTGFLKKTEMKAIIEGRDLWLRDVDITARLKSMNAA